MQQKNQKDKDHEKDLTKNLQDKNHEKDLTKNLQDKNHEKDLTKNLQDKVFNCDVFAFYKKMLCLLRSSYLRHGP